MESPSVGNAGVDEMTAAQQLSCCLGKQAVPPGQDGPIESSEGMVVKLIVWL